MKTTANSLAFRVSSEELLYLLTALNLSTLPDMGPSPFAGISSEQKEQLLISGLNGLLSKGWVSATSTNEGPQVAIDNVFSSALITCATARQMLTLSKRSKSEPFVQFHLYRTEQLIVSHRIIEPTTHEFILTSELSEFDKLFEELSGKIARTGDQQAPSFSVSGNDVPKMMDFIKTRDISGIRHILVGQQVPKASIKAFFACLENLAHVILAVSVVFSEKMESPADVRAKTTTILVANGAWMIMDQGNDELRFSVLGDVSLKDFWEDAV